MKIDHHLDYDALAALRDVMEDDFGLLVDTFVQDSRLRMQTLLSLINSPDGDAIRRAAHSFKGSCSNLGVLGLASLCGALEHKSLQSNFSSLPEDVHAIEEEFVLIQKMLLEYMQ
jgi:histidine phosphotransfer protein HptB